MGFFDRFRSKRDTIGKEKKLKHVVGDAQAKKDKKEREREEKEALKKQFRSVPSGKSSDRPAAATDTRDAHASKDAARKAPKTPAETGDAYRILLRPVVSEKSTMIVRHRQYVFQVAPYANKIQVADAVRRVYGVHPEKVRMLNVRGRFVRHGRTEGVTNAWKKAIVTLRDGEHIESYETK